MATTHWTVENIPAQTGRTALVTGANSGLGYEVSLALAGKGARVVMACRTVSKGETARQQILQQAPGAALEVMALDLADLASVRRFAEQFRAKYDRLDLLINNAGVMATPRRETADGFELQFGTNHLGHFALTGLLLELLLRTPNSRIVNVSSTAAQMGQMNFEDLMSQKSYGRWAAYGQSKLANLLFTHELQRRLATLGTGPITVAAHPGFSSTNLQHTGPSMDGSNWQHWLLRLLLPFAQDVTKGALPLLYAATAPGVQGGHYYGPAGMMELWGYPGQAELPAAAKDEAAAQRLWQVSEELTGVRYETLSPPLYHLS